MATNYYDADDYFFVKSETNTLKVSVQLGQEMSGGYLIFHGKQLIGVNEGTMLNQKDFIDDWITVAIIIKDTPTDDNWGSVMVTLQEDSQIPKSFGPYRNFMAQNIDTVSYIIKVKIRK